MAAPPSQPGAYLVGLRTLDGNKRRWVRVQVSDLTLTTVEEAADDDTQIRSTQHVVAVPPFVLGMKVPRYLAQKGAIEPDILAADADGKPRPGIAMTARLVHRNWNSVLQASDFSQGSAKYVTQVIDETVEERQVASTEDVQHLHFDAPEAGVYIVELEAADRIGRRQTLRVDLFMGGDTPVTWSQPPSQTVAVSTDKDSYAPGETATLLIQSPFQTARAGRRRGAGRPLPL